MTDESHQKMISNLGDEEKLISSSLPSEMNPDFLVIRIVARIVFSVIRQCWAVCGALLIMFCFLFWNYGGFAALLLLFFSALVVVYHAGDKMLYYPETPSNSHIFVPAPNTVGLPFENITIKSLDSTKLHAFLILQPQPQQCCTILFFHGNAGNIGHRLSNAKGMYRHLKANILLLEYRGYGLSEGVPSESGFYKDAQAAFNYLCSRQDINKDRIIVFGRSLGGAVAINLASKPCNSSIYCLLVENSFTSIPDMAKQIIPWKGMKYIPLWFHKNKFLNKKSVARIQCPVVFVSGLSDQLVPPSMMLDLYTHCASPRKLLFQVANGDHNGTWTKPQYYPQLVRHIEDVCNNRSHLQDMHLSVHTI